ncbi:hypothetical protein [Terrabacter sp. MAHUQ-38]|uniref:hypothetical protein n=1 Tax=unclassified Terrabacter TaxID=2630222 RepID=UPI00165E5596|nr:hypothetical protein [Terrabacter sp. MAHUQ-38]MBC9819696.1 hypothetical protein [Terrabacter sp. MAHUQ-38]
MGMVFVGAGLLLLAFFAFTGGALAMTIVLAVAGLVLLVTGALLHARSLDG